MPDVRCLLVLAAALLGLPLASGEEPGDPAVIIKAFRTAGVAPLPLFFDATESPLSAGSKHDAFYEWSFADPESSHPTARGFVAAHVFEEPGEYEVSLKVTDRDGTLRTGVVRVTVEAFEGTTYFVSARGKDTHDGRSEKQAFRSFDRAMKQIDVATRGKPAAVRVLFRRGDVFPTMGYKFGNNRVGRPIIIGAFGRGERPVISNEGKAATFDFGSNVRGWRFVDLEIRGGFNLEKQSGDSPIGIHMWTGGDRLLLRCVMKQLAHAYVEIGGSNSGDDREDLYLFDNELADTVSSHVYLGGKRLAIIGNRMERCSTTHVLRVWRASGAVISDNVLLDPSVNSGAGRHALKLHAQRDGLHTENVVVSGNEFRGSSWPVMIAPQNKASVEYVHDVVFERNVVRPNVLEKSGRPTNQSLGLFGYDLTVRNNLFLGPTDASSWAAVSIKDYSATGIELAKIRIQSNTAIHPPGRASRTVFLEVSDFGVKGLEVTNNLLVGVPGGRGSCFAKLPERDLLDSSAFRHNLAHVGGGYVVVGGGVVSLEAWQSWGFGPRSLQVDPRISAGRPRPGRRSAAVGRGLTVPGVREDLLGQPRPQDGAVTIGAYEASPGGGK